MATSSIIEKKKILSLILSVMKTTETFWVTSH